MENIKKMTSKESDDFVTKNSLIIEEEVLSRLTADKNYDYKIDFDGTPKEGYEERAQKYFDENPPKVEGMPQGYSEFNTLLIKTSKTDPTDVTQIDLSEEFQNK